ncbi:MAG: ABC transporter substrate-binding protein [Dongiaceae bacterium]
MSKRTSKPTILRPTRRTFLAGATALGTAVLAGAPLIGRAKADEPRKGGKLRVAMGPGSTSDSLDPATYWDSPQYTAGFTIGNALVEIDSQKKPTPELAESWDSSADLKKWSFKLRKGVQFHNGKSLTSADVVYSLKRHIAKDSTSAAKGLLSSIEDITADGPDAVTVTHATGTPDLPVIFGDFHLTIAPEGFSDWNNFIGTGPYKVSRFEPGNVLETKRNENYWKPNRAWVDEFDLVFINDHTAATNALLTGELQAVAQIAAQTAERLKSRGGFNLIVSDGAATNHLSMNSQSKTFSDPNVRLAVKSAVPRAEMLKFIGRGYGVVGNDHPIPPNDPYYNPNIKQREQDPDKTKWYLKQAGLSSLDLDLHVSDAAYSGAVDSTALFKEAAKPAGININIKKEPADGYWSNIWLKRDFVVAYAGCRPTPDMMFSIFFQCNAPWNEGFWCNDKFEKLLLVGRSTTDFETRKQAYWEMQQIVHDDGGEAIFMFPSIIDAYAPSVAGVSPDGVRTMMGGRVAERAWLSA